VGTARAYAIRPYDSTNIISSCSQGYPFACSNVKVDPRESLYGLRGLAEPPRFLLYVSRWGDCALNKINPGGV
jgi:hypothetical protein